MQCVTATKESYFGMKFESSRELAKTAPPEEAEFEAIVQFVAVTVEPIA